MPFELWIFRNNQLMDDCRIFVTVTSIYSLCRRLSSLLKMLKFKKFLVQLKIHNDISLFWIVLNVRVYSHVILFNMDFSVILYTGTLTYMRCICLNIHLIMLTIYSRCKTTLLYIGRAISTCFLVFVLITIISWEYLNLSLANEYVGDVTIPTQVINYMYHQFFSRLISNQIAVFISI